MKVIVVNYGMGNLASVRRAVENCGADVRVTENPADLVGADRIMLPGVGSFSEGMANLSAAGWPAEIRRALANPRVAILGICLGMQLLADKGFEGGETEGLGLIPGAVDLMAGACGERIPHVGWNDISVVRSGHLLSGIDTGTDFYFVHSYRFQTLNELDVMAETSYCGDFASIVRSRNAFGTQFHPEKSSHMGLRLIRNFLSWSVTDA
jgi:imidazole glycerol-phosphate synthase subunit HisH